jgi:hypothetical protein
MNIHWTTYNLQKIPVYKYFYARRKSHKHKPLSHSENIIMQLHDLGVSRYGLQSAESSHLPKIIHKNEKLKAVSYGHYEVGFTMLVATNKRILHLDRKPFFVNIDDIPYDSVIGASLQKSSFRSTLVLKTKNKDYQLQTFNETCGNNFVQHIESELHKD